MAYISVILLLFHPLLYPYVRYGWASVSYGIGTVAAAFFWNRYEKNGHLRNLWMSVFSLCFMANIHFYFMWDVVALVLSMLIIYPKEIVKTIFNIKKFFIMLSAVVVGLLNYVIYNIVDGFPTIRVLYNYIFNKNEYNASYAIDNRESGGILSEIGRKLAKYLDIFGERAFIFEGICIVGAAITIFLIVYYVKKGKWEDKKAYFIPFFGTVLTLLLMLFTPNAIGSQHLAYLVLPFSLWFAGLFSLLLQEVQKGTKKIVYVSAGLIAFFFAVESNLGIVQANKTKGTEYFSNNIYDLVDYIEETPEVSDDNTVFPQWGMAAQVYFLNRGELDIEEWNYDAGNEERLSETIIDYLRDFDEDTLYLPIRNVLNGEYEVFIPQGNELEDYSLRMDEAPHMILELLQQYGGVCSVKETFDQESGQKGIVLVQVDHVDKVKENFRYRAFTEEEKEAVDTDVFLKSDITNPVRGIYEYEKESQTRWASPDAAILLNNSAGETQLKLKCMMTENLDYDDGRKFQVYCNGELVEEMIINSAGSYEWILDLDEDCKGLAEIELIFEGQVDSTEDERTLSYLIEEIAFIE